MAGRPTDPATSPSAWVKRTNLEQAHNIGDAVAHGHRKEKIIRIDAENGAYEFRSDEDAARFSTRV